MFLETMTKERLSRFFSLKIQTENHLERITRLKSKAQFPEMPENDGSSRNPGAGDPMGNTIVKRITYEEEISEQLEANLTEMEAIQKAVLSLEDRNEQECLRCRYIDVIEDDEGNRKRLTWRDVALRVYRKDDECAIRASTASIKGAGEHRPAGVLFIR